MKRATHSWSFSLSGLLSKSHESIGNIFKCYFSFSAYNIAAGRAETAAPDADQTWNERPAVADGRAEERDRFPAARLQLFDLLPGQVCRIGKFERAPLVEVGPQRFTGDNLELWFEHLQEMEHQQELQRMRSDIEALSAQLVDSKETVRSLGRLF